MAEMAGRTELLAACSWRLFAERAYVCRIQCVIDGSFIYRRLLQCICIDRVLFPRVYVQALRPSLISPHVYTAVS